MKLASAAFLESLDGYTLGDRIQPKPRWVINVSIHKGK
jgi:hypothetical protein